jgi:FMN phosphatase YigB (HAD superfamily)
MPEAQKNKIAKESNVLHQLSEFEPGARVLVLDMDGTLYSVDKIVEKHAKRLFKHISQEKLENAEKEYKLAREGICGPCIGTTYDVKNDMLLELGQDMKVVAAYKWDGSKLNSNDIMAMYPEPVKHNLESMLSIGDGWWIPLSITLHHYSGSAEDRLALSKQTGEDYIATKQYMHEHPEEFRIPRNESIVNALKEFRKSGNKVIVATNSGLEDAQRVLDQLGILDLCDEVVARAGKPTNSDLLFKSISRSNNLRKGEGISIGDNVLNEILPAKLNGFKTIFVGNPGKQNLFGTDVVADTIKDALSIIRH